MPCIHALYRYYRPQYSANLICARQAAVGTVVAIFIVHGMCLFSWGNGPGLRLGCPVSGIVLYD